MVMNIVVNGEAKILETPINVGDLLQDMGLAGRRVAVEINLEIIPRSRYSEQLLQNNDRVEIVRAIGGG